MYNEFVKSICKIQDELPLAHDKCYRLDITLKFFAFNNYFLRLYCVLGITKNKCYKK